MTYSLGEKIKHLRMSFDLSQEELADQLNQRFHTSINKGMISKWENNLGEPRLDTAKLLAIFFNISVDELLNVKSPSEHAADTIAAHHDGETWTEEELEEIERFKAFVRSKRNKEG